MLEMLKSAGAAHDDMMESFLTQYDKNVTSIGHRDLFGIDRDNERQTVLFKPAFGLFNQTKYISLKYSPLTIELELDSDETANIITPDPDASYNTSYPSTGWAKSFEIQKCILRADIIKIDSELQNKYDDHLMSGGAINLNYTTYHSQFLKEPSGGHPKDFWMKPHKCFYHTLRVHNRVSAKGNIIPHYNNKKNKILSNLANYK